MPANHRRRNRGAGEAIAPPPDFKVKYLKFSCHDSTRTEHCQTVKVKFPETAPQNGSNKKISFYSHSWAPVGKVKQCHLTLLARNFSYFDHTNGKILDFDPRIQQKPLVLTHPGPWTIQITLHPHWKKFCGRSCLHFTQ